MSRLRRYFKPGDTVFITFVTMNRAPILTEAVDLFREALSYARRRFGFDVIAGCMMPDHVHLILESCGESVPEIVKCIKSKFSGMYRSRLGLRKGRVWQHRYWDRIVRNQQELNQYIDYIHYNPVHHGLVDHPRKYPHSSYSRFADAGIYQDDWGSTRPEGLLVEVGE